MTTGTHKARSKRRPGAGRAPQPRYKGAGVQHPQRRKDEVSLGPDLMVLLAKPNLVQAIEQMEIEALTRLTGMATRKLAADLQALSLALLRVSVRLEEVPRPAKGRTSPQARSGEVARSSRDLHEIARRNREALVRGGELVTAKTLADELGLSPQAVTKARNEKRFFALEVGAEDYYPGFYADPGLDRKVLEHITRLLGDLPGAEKWVFFRSALGSLADLTPLAALRAGKRAAVERAAVALAER